MQPEPIAASPDKQTAWEQKLLEMEHLQDNWGTELDQGIKETVAVLQLFSTGHFC